MAFKSPPPIGSTFLFLLLLLISTLSLLTTAYFQQSCCSLTGNFNDGCTTQSNPLATSTLCTNHQNIFNAHSTATPSLLPSTCDCSNPLKLYNIKSEGFCNDGSNQDGLKCPLVLTSTVSAMCSCAWKCDNDTSTPSTNCLIPGFEPTQTCDDCTGCTYNQQPHCVGTFSWPTLSPYPHHTTSHQQNNNDCSHIHPVPLLQSTVPNTCQTMWSFEKNALVTKRDCPLELSTCGGCDANFPPYHSNLLYCVQKVVKTDGMNTFVRYEEVDSSRCVLKLRPFFDIAFCESKWSLTSTGTAMIPPPIGSPCPNINGVESTCDSCDANDQVKCVMVVSGTNHIVRLSLLQSWCSLQSTKPQWDNVSCSYSWSLSSAEFVQPPSPSTPDPIPCPNQLSCGSCPANEQVSCMKYHSGSQSWILAENESFCSSVQQKPVFSTDCDYQWSLIPSGTTINSGDILQPMMENQPCPTTSVCGTCPENNQIQCIAVKPNTNIIVETSSVDESLCSTAFITQNVENVIDDENDESSNSNDESNVQQMLITQTQTPSSKPLYLPNICEYRCILYVPQNRPDFDPTNLDHFDIQMTLCPADYADECSCYKFPCVHKHSQACYNLGPNTELDVNTGLPLNAALIPNSNCIGSGIWSYAGSKPQCDYKWAYNHKKQPADLVGICPDNTCGPVCTQNPSDYLFCAVSDIGWNAWGYSPDINRCIEAGLDPEDAVDVFLPPVPATCTPCPTCKWGCLGQNGEYSADCGTNPEFTQCPPGSLDCSCEITRTIRCFDSSISTTSPVDDLYCSQFSPAPPPIKVIHNRQDVCDACFHNGHEHFDKLDCSVAPAISNFEITWLPFPSTPSQIPLYYSDSITFTWEYQGSWSTLAQIHILTPSLHNGSTTASTPLVTVQAKQGTYTLDLSIISSDLELQNVTFKLVVGNNLLVSNIAPPAPATFKLLPRCASPSHCLHNSTCNMTTGICVCDPSSTFLMGDRCEISICGKPSSYPSPTIAPLQCVEKNSQIHPESQDLCFYPNAAAAGDYSTAQCNCKAGILGNRCEDTCTSVPAPHISCLHGEYRNFGPNRCLCSCDANWTGEFCDEYNPYGNNDPCALNLGNCSGRGVPNSTCGLCVCNQPFLGEICQYSPVISLIGGKLVDLSYFQPFDQAFLGYVVAFEEMQALVAETGDHISPEAKAVVKHFKQHFDIKLQPAIQTLITDLIINSATPYGLIDKLKQNPTIVAADGSINRTNLLKYASLTLSTTTFSTQGSGATLKKVWNFNLNVWIEVNRAWGMNSVSDYSAFISAIVKYYRAQQP